MARSIWKGSIAFGLVNIPVSLTGAEAKPDIQLHMVDSKNHARIRYERVNADTGDEVPWDRMVRGYEHDDGKLVLLSDAELEAAAPKLTKSIEITEFVDLKEIDPLLFDKPYYLEPEKRGRKAYALLREALRKSGKAGISRVVIRTREYLSAMFVREDVLVLMLLRFPQEIKSWSKLELPSSRDKEWQPVKRELELAGRLIDDMSGKWRPDEFHDEYRESLMTMIETKIRTGESVADGSDPEKERADDGKVVDLAAYLEQSVRMNGKGKPAVKKGAKKTGAKKAPRNGAGKPTRPAKKAARKKARSA